MSSPRVPDDARNWNAIDIFLFSNGQQYSPPRKYHLTLEELKLWDTTLDLLARSQFGCLHSNIELYTLDGKKIDAPLELSNGAAYVVVKAPDGFIQAGYEEYLLKASRSREKRQERLNSIETAKSANIEAKKEQFKSNLVIPDATTNNKKKVEDGISLDTDIEYSTTIASNTESLREKQTTNNSLKTETPEILPIQKPVNNVKNTILKKVYLNSKNKEDRPTLIKKRNQSFSKNIIKPSNNSQRLNISSNESNILKKNNDSKADAKEKHQTNINKTVKHIPETKGKPEIVKNDPLLKNYSSGKDLTLLSDVYKNTDSDIQSNFLDADRKTALLNNSSRKDSCTLDNIEEFVEMPKINVKDDIIISKQSTVNMPEGEIPNNISQPGTLHLHLNIDLKGCTVHPDKNNVIICKSYTTLIKPEKASQINIDVNLCSEDDSFLQEQSIDSNVVKTCDKNIGENNKKVTIIRCKCSSYKPDRNILSIHKENENYTLLIPNQIETKLMQRGDQKTRRISDKEFQELLHSCIRVPVTSPSDTGTYKKHKVSISQEAPTELNSDIIQDKSQGDVHTIIPNNISASQKIDDFAQTDWCNILLQAKLHEDGRYTFHWPSLHMLAHYNLL